MNIFTKLLRTLPLRWSMVVLGIVVLAPMVMLGHWLFPAVSRESFAISIAFVIAAGLSFLIMGKPRRRRSR